MTSAISPPMTQPSGRANRCCSRVGQSSRNSVTVTTAVTRNSRMVARSTSRARSQARMPPAMPASRVTPVCIPKLWIIAPTAMIWAKTV